MLSIATTKQMRDLESEWIKKCDPHWGQVLMEVAGNGTAKIAHRMLSEQWDGSAGTVYVFCGSGNNGGDGLVIARYLKLWHHSVKVFFVAKDKQSGASENSMSTEESNVNKRIAASLGIEFEDLDSIMGFDFEDCDLIVDALFGTGLDRAVTGNFRALIELINDSERDVLAVDIPSGINSDTGQVMGVAIRASRTVTFGYLKPGHLCHPGAAACGSVHLIDIGLPDQAERTPSVFLPTVEAIAELLPRREENSNKGSFGTVLTVAGSLGMSGATLFSARSSLLVGCGLCFLATPKSLVTSLPPGEVIYRPLSETKELSISPAAIEELEEYLKKSSAVVLGPGMSTHDETVNFVHEFVEQTLAKADLPCIIDADALNAISKQPGCVPKNNKFVLTPHPKELSRLTGRETHEIQADRLTAALEAAKKYNCVVVLKGSFSVIADQFGRVAFNTTGSAAMAKAGAGDVLSGIIGGLLAQKLDPFSAALVGTYVHGRAGEIASAHLGMSGVLASDLSEFIPQAVESILAGEPARFEAGLHEPGVPARLS